MRRSLAPSELLSTVDLNLQERPPLPPNCRPRPAAAARGSGPTAIAADMSAVAARGSGPAANAAAGSQFAAACNDAATPPGAPRTEFMLPAAGPLALV